MLRCCGPTDGNFFAATVAAETIVRNRRRSTASYGGRRYAVQGSGVVITSRESWAQAFLVPPPRP